MNGFKWWDALQASEAKVVARVRALIFMLGVLGAAEAQNIADGLAWPESAKWFRRVFTVCMGLSLLLRAGEKNNETKP
jgi:hypothetical protein